MLLLSGRDLLLLPAPYAVRLGHASADTRSAGIQDRGDRLVVLRLADIHPYGSKCLSRDRANGIVLLASAILR
jgi:hypothetical protein